jgi:hypothetical protein
MRDNCGLQYVSSHLQKYSNNPLAVENENKMTGEGRYEQYQMILQRHQ